MYYLLLIVISLLFLFETGFHPVAQAGVELVAASCPSLLNATTIGVNRTHISEYLWYFFPSWCLSVYFLVLWSWLESPVSFSLLNDISKPASLGRTRWNAVGDIWFHSSDGPQLYHLMAHRNSLRTYGYKSLPCHTRRWCAGWGRAKAIGNVLSKN